MEKTIPQHQQIQNILDKQMENGNLSHAYLFVGPKGTGKKELAKEFAGKVISEAFNNSNTTPPQAVPHSLAPMHGSGFSTGGETLQRHPDYMEFDCLQDTEEQAKSVREFIGRIALKPFVAKKKFALILNIENLNLQGANALLKTLEEPPANTVMVLLANTRKILPTIVSRCQVFNINRVNIPSQFANTTPPRSEHRDTPPIIGGEKISDFSGKSLAERLNAINKFAELEDNEFSEKVEEFVYYTAEKLSAEPQKYTHLSAGLKAFADLNTNKNKKFIMQGLMMKI